MPWLNYLKSPIYGGFFSMEHRNPTRPGLHLGSLGSGQQLQGRTAEAVFVTRDRLLAGLHQQGNYGKPMGNTWQCQNLASK